MKRLGSVFLAVALAASLPPIEAAASDATRGDWIAGLARSRELRGPILAEGTLQSAAGIPVPGRVLVVAWPVSTSLSALEIGDSFRTLPVAQDTVGSDGRFALRVDPAVPLREYTEANGNINFELYADTDLGRASFSFARKSVSGVWTQPSRPGSAAAPIAVTVDLALGRSQHAGATSAVPTAGVPEDKDWGCPNYVVARYDQRWTAIGETYPGPSASAELIYTSGASSELGVAYSVSGEYGSYSSSGAHSQSSTVEFDWRAKRA